MICIVAAFGAAFLVARAVNHDTPARAATPPPKLTPVAAVTSHSASRKVNAELVSQFAPLKASLRPRPKPHHKHKAKPKPAVSSTPVAPATTPQTEAPTTPVEPTPTYSSPAPSTSSSAPTHSSSSGSATHHKSGGSSGGSGTTTIGG